MIATVVDIAETIEAKIPNKKNFAVSEIHFINLEDVYFLREDGTRFYKKTLPGTFKKGDVVND